MKKQHKIAYICIAAAVALAMTVGMTLAYLGDQKSKENKVNVGVDKAQVSEYFPEVSIQTSGSNVFPKQVKVKNTGSVPCFVRAYVAFSDSRIEAKSQVTNGTLDYMSFSYFKSTLETNDSNDWTFVSSGDDKIKGYFYYTKAVNPGDETKYLIQSVKTTYETSNVDEISDFEVIVYTETVQTTEINAYGTVYGDDDWMDAWKSFLRVPTT